MRKFCLLLILSLALPVFCLLQAVEPPKKEIRAELSKTRSAMSEIGSRVSEEIYRRRADRNKEQER